MNFEHTQVFNFEGALRGMRNPLNSWAKSDSHFGICNELDYTLEEYQEYAEENPNMDYEATAAGIESEHCFEYRFIGPADMDLAKRLIAGGSEHRKFLRQILVSVDITAPIYLWKELSTYKVGTTANSTSTMHKLASTPITMECFETDDFENIVYSIEDNGDSFVEVTTGDLSETFVEELERLRQKYLETKDKRYWKELVRWLPMGWLQTRTWTANYEVLRSMYHQRKNHKLTEWKAFCEWCESLPYAQEFIIN